MNEIRYIVTWRLFSTKGYNTFRYRKLAFEFVDEIIMHNGACVIEMEERINGIWISKGRLIYD